MKNLPTVSAVAALLLSTPLWAQGNAASKQHNAQIADMCATGKCQRNLHVVLKEKTGASFDRTFETFPAVVQPIGFVVVAGQTVYVEADVVDGKLVNLTAVENISDPRKTIAAKFEQVDGKDMVLTISNPYQKPLKFNMGVMPLDQERLLKTSSCPIGPGMKAFESWPYPIFQVVLARGRLLREDDASTCTD